MGLLLTRESDNHIKVLDMRTKQVAYRAVLWDNGHQKLSRKRHKTASGALAYGAAVRLRLHRMFLRGRRVE